jgi:hypothetical protein
VHVATLAIFLMARLREPYLASYKTSQPMVFDTQDTGPAFFGPYVPV